MGLIRAFIAIPLPTALKRQIETETESLRTQIDSRAVRWVAPQNIHITLKFLGDTEENRLKKLEKLLAEAMVEFSPFHLAVGGLGVYPHKGRPNVIWLGVEKNKNLLELQKRIEGLASQIGSVPERRRFSAHLTLGRVKRSGHHEKARIQIRQAIEASPQVDFGRIRVDAVHLFQSELTPQGAKYRSLFKAKLGDFFE